MQIDTRIARRLTVPKFSPLHFRAEFRPPPHTPHDCHCCFRCCYVGFPLAYASLHEIVHAVATQIGHQSMKEGMVDALAYGIYQVMRENPGPVRMIVQ